jgi:hypothetical protein
MGHPKTRIFKKRRARRGKGLGGAPRARWKKLPQDHPLRKAGRGLVDVVALAAGFKLGGIGGAARSVSAVRGIRAANDTGGPPMKLLQIIKTITDLFDGKKTKGTGGIMIILGILGIFFPQLKEYVAADPDAAVDAISALFAAFGGMVIWFRGWKDRQLIDQAKLTGQPVVFRASPVELEGWVEADPTDNLGD